MMFIADIGQLEGYKGLFILNWRKGMNECYLALIYQMCNMQYCNLFRSQLEPQTALLTSITRNGSFSRV